MKLRLIIKRTVQPPIDSSASVDFRTIDVDVDAVTERFMRGADCNGCAVSANVIGSEILDGKEII